MRKMDVVAVGVDDQRATGQAEKQSEMSGFPHTRGILAQVEAVGAGVILGRRLNRFPRTVGGSIVGNDNLEEASVVLLEDRSKGCANVGAMLVGGEEQGDRGEGHRVASGAAIFTPQWLISRLQWAAKYCCSSDTWCMSMYPSRNASPMFS